MLYNQMSTVFSNSKKDVYAKRCKIPHSREWLHVWLVKHDKEVVFFLVLQPQISFWFPLIPLFSCNDRLCIDLKSLLCQLRLKSKEFQVPSEAIAELFRNFKPHPNAGVSHSQSSACWGPSSLSMRERCFRSRAGASVVVEQGKSYKSCTHFLPLASHSHDFPSAVLHSLVKVSHHRNHSRSMILPINLRNLGEKV